MNNQSEQLISDDLLIYHHPTESDLKKKKITRSWGPRNVYRKTLFANLTLRRRAKQLFFKELLLSLKMGMPLDEALNAMAKPKSKAEAVRRYPTRSISFKWIIGTAIALFLFILWIEFAANQELPLLQSGGNVVTYRDIFSRLFASILPLFLILFLLFSRKDYVVGNLVRRLAEGIYPHITAGLPLSAAMEQWTAAFTQKEIYLIKNGEHNGLLINSLEQLTEMNEAEEKLSTYINNLFLYPSLLLYISLLISAFILTFILSKSQDVMNQLDMDSPFITNFLLDYGNLLTYVLSPISVLSFIYLQRITLVGAPMKFLYLYQVIISSVVFAFLSLDTSSPTLTSIGFIVGLAALGVFAAPYILYAIEGIVNGLERWLMSALGFIPGFRYFRQDIEAARWLAILKGSLKTGTSTVDSVTLSSGVLGGRYRNKLKNIGAKAESGIPLGKACKHAKLFDPYINNRLAELDSAPDYIGGLDTLQTEISDRAVFRMRTLDKLASIITPCIVGAITLAIVLAIYLPLFSLVHYVGVPE